MLWCVFLAWAFLLTPSRGPQRPVNVVSRSLNIHEWQSKELLSKYGVTVQKFGLVKDASKAASVASALGACFGCCARAVLADHAAQEPRSWLSRPKCTPADAVR